MALLAQCQQCAIDLGQMIEEEEGEGTKAVSCLEEYCEQVYQFYSEISQGQKINGHKAAKTLRKALVQTENSIKNDIKVCGEAVFLPYKASMWDSLESVWKAADEDPDGSFKELRYEGDQYPDYVPVTHYNDYNFGSHKPGMIFIHNPYDKRNYVTSVHPFFMPGI